LSFAIVDCSQGLEEETGKVEKRIKDENSFENYSEEKLSSLPTRLLRVPEGMKIE